MGVLGLWQILDSVGHPIKIDGLEGRRLAVDANIWLHQFIRGFREKNNSNIESHKLGLFNRVCKLMFYKIKPVFVFDGPAPALKRRTLDRRQNMRSNINQSKVQDRAAKLLAEHLKNQFPDVDISAQKICRPELQSINLAASDIFGDDNNLFSLPPPTKQEENVSSDEEYEFEAGIDINSEDFKALPAETRYEILKQKKEKSRRNRFEELPEKPDDFMSFQFNKLKKRREVQQKIEEAEREISGAYTGEMTYRIQSDPDKFMLYTKKHPFEDLPKISEQKPAIPPESQPVPEKPDNFMSPQFNKPKKRREVEQKIEEAEREISEAHTGEMTYRIQSDPDKFMLCTQKQPSEDLPKIIEQKPAIPPESQPTPKPAPKPKLIVNPICVDLVTPERPTAPGSTSKPILQAERLSSPEVEEFEEVLEPAAPSTQPICVDLASPERTHGPTPELDPQTSRTPSPEFEQQHPASQPTPGPKSQVGAKPAPEHARPASQPVPPTRSAFSELMAKRTVEPIPETQVQAKPPELAQLDNAQSSSTSSSANPVSSRIVEEAKELLTLFGIPFMNAKGEAEAQCALLESLGLTDGTITDDSDIWLFGAKNVYRYFFSDDKWVMQYKMTDIEFHIRMNRENLVCFAMLVGSDYTDGIMNVGPVTALEILSEFRGDKIAPLVQYREFVEEYKNDAKRITGTDIKKRRRLLKYQLPDEFPSQMIFEGYMQPVADQSSEKFTWGTPDWDALKEYARRNFAWDAKKIDEKLQPVMKKCSENTSQPTIDKFFFKTAANLDPERFRSKRINEALRKISKVGGSQESAEATQSSTTTTTTTQESQEKSQKPKATRKRATTTTRQSSRKAASKNTKNKRTNQQPVPEVVCLSETDSDD